MQELIQEIAKIIGVNPALIEGSVSTLLLLSLVYVTRALLQSHKTDDKQVTFEQQLVKMANDAVEESRKQREAYEQLKLAIKDNAQATKESSMVSQELVKVVRELNASFPERIAAHESATVKLFMDKADEMHGVTVRRDTEMAEDRNQRDVNHKYLLERLDEQRVMILSLVKELTDDTDATTLRSELNMIVRKFDEILAHITPEEEQADGVEPVGSTLDE